MCKIQRRHATHEGLSNLRGCIESDCFLRRSLPTAYQRIVAFIQMCPRPCGDVGFSISLHDNEGRSLVWKKSSCLENRPFFSCKLSHVQLESTLACSYSPSLRQSTFGPPGSLHVGLQLVDHLSSCVFLWLFHSIPWFGGPVVGVALPKRAVCRRIACFCT